MQGGAHSWGQDRMDQLHLPLDNQYNLGDLDGRGIHGACELPGNCLR
jgi:hypothetical protein